MARRFLLRASVQVGERPSRRLRTVVRVLAMAASLVCSACDEVPTSSGPSGARRVRIVFLGATTRRPDLPASAEACINGVGATHIHPSWRSFTGMPLQPVPPDRYEITFDDVPVTMRVSFRVNDQ